MAVCAAGSTGAGDAPAGAGSSVAADIGVAAGAGAPAAAGGYWATPAPDARQFFCEAKVRRYSCLLCRAEVSVLAAPWKSIPNHSGQINSPATPAARFCATFSLSLTRKFLNLYIVRLDFNRYRGTVRESILGLDHCNRLRCPPGAARQHDRCPYRYVSFKSAHCSALSAGWRMY